MKIMNGSFAFVALVGLAGTGCPQPEEPAGKITAELKDADGALTDEGGDALFTIEVKELAEPIEVDALIVHANLADVDPVELAYEHTDADEDGKISQGDSLVVSEGDENVFGVSLLNSDVEIELLQAAAEAEGEPESLATLTWTPADEAAAE